MWVFMSKNSVRPQWQRITLKVCRHATPFPPLHCFRCYCHQMFFHLSAKLHCKALFSNKILYLLCPGKRLVPLAENKSLLMFRGTHHSADGTVDLHDTSAISTAECTRGSSALSLITKLSHDRSHDFPVTL